LAPYTTLFRSDETVGQGLLRELNRVHALDRHEADGGDEQGEDRQRGDDAHPQAQMGPAAAALLLQSSPGWAHCTVLSSVGEWLHGCSGRVRHPGELGLLRRLLTRSRDVLARAAPDDRELLIRS